MNDPELTPISKAQQRMASALPGEVSPLSGSVCRPERNGIFFIHCFICGSGVTPGKELSLQVKYQREKDGPFFPFLQGQDPAPGAPEIGPDGDALVCAVCHCFLREQWNSFERNRTPIEKRMYWLKRPYQCDLRNIHTIWSEEWALAITTPMSRTFPHSLIMTCPSRTWTCQRV